MQVTIVKHLISHEDACAVMKKLNAKKHAHLGFYFDLQPLNMTLAKAYFSHGDAKRAGMESAIPDEYRDYSIEQAKQPAYLLTVYRDIVRRVSTCPFTEEEIRVLKNHAAFLLRFEQSGAVMG